MKAYQRLLIGPLLSNGCRQYCSFWISDLTIRSGWLADARDLRARILAKSRIGKAEYNRSKNVANARGKKK